MTVSPSRNLLRNDGSFYNTSEVRYSPIVPPSIGGYELFRQVDDLTNIVYKDSRRDRLYSLLEG